MSAATRPASPDRTDQGPSTTPRLRSCLPATRATATDRPLFLPPFGAQTRPVTAPRALPLTAWPGLRLRPFPSVAPSFLGVLASGQASLPPAPCLPRMRWILAHPSPPGTPACRDQHDRHFRPSLCFDTSPTRLIIAKRWSIHAVPKTAVGVREQHRARQAVCGFVITCWVDQESSDHFGWSCRRQASGPCSVWIRGWSFGAFFPRRTFGLGHRIGQTALLGSGALESRHGVLDSLTASSRRCSISGRTRRPVHCPRSFPQQHPAIGIVAVDLGVGSMFRFPFVWICSAGLEAGTSERFRCDGLGLGFRPCDVTSFLQLWVPFSLAWESHFQGLPAFSLHTASSHPVPSLPRPPNPPLMSC